MKQSFIAILSLILLSSCHDLKEPELRGIEKMKFGKLGFNNSTVILYMKYFNPNHFKAKLKEAEGDAWMDSSYLGHFRVDTLVEVPANSDFTIPVKLKVDMKYVLQHTLSAFSNKEFPESLNTDPLIRVSGTARAGRNGFYKSFPIRYEGKQDLAKLFGQNANPE